MDVNIICFNTLALRIVKICFQTSAENPLQN